MNTEVVAGPVLAGAGRAVSAPRSARVSQGSPERASRQVCCHRNSRPPSLVWRRRDTGLLEFLDVRDSAVQCERSPLRSARRLLHSLHTGWQQLAKGPCRLTRRGQYRRRVRCHVWVGRGAMMCDANLEAVALSVGSVTLCDDWCQSAPVGHVWKEGA